jgi:hypothetical protein
MIYGDEDEAGQISPSAVPAKENPNNPGRRNSRASTSSPVFHPPEYRRVLANWPDEWREQWGRRANALEENGLSWRDAETQAFVEVWNRLRGHLPAQTTEQVLTEAAAERN